MADVFFYLNYFTNYNLQRGDSLWKISQQYQIKVPDLIELNNLENLTIQIGQKLLVPKK